MCLWKSLTLTAQPWSANAPLRGSRERCLALRGCRWACESPALPGVSEYPHSSRSWVHSNFGGSIGTDQSCAWDHPLLPQGCGSAAQEKAWHSCSRQTGFCFPKQITLSQGNSFIHLFESNRKSVVFNFAIKMSTWLIL